MKTVWLALSFLALSTNTFEQTNDRSAVHIPTNLLPTWSLGKALYPQASYLPEATQRLLELRTSTWLVARVFHTEDSIKVVAEYFKYHAQEANVPLEADGYFKSLLRDNWKIENRPLRLASILFGAGSELRTSNEKAETSAGVIVLDDSVVRVHLLSPHPSSPDNNKLAAGTMIVLIRERLTHQGGLVVGGPGVSGEKQSLYGG